VTFTTLDFIAGSFPDELTCGRKASVSIEEYWIMRRVSMGIGRG